MIVTIHQPEHLPWLGFFQKMKHADCMVLLDNVDYRKNYFQNRNRILTSNGITYLTLPVLPRLSASKLIKDIRNSQDSRIMKKYLKTLYYAYYQHPHFKEHYKSIKRILERNSGYLAELNIAIIDYISHALGINTTIIKASDLHVTGNKSELLLNICKETGADIYLSGPSGKAYLDEALFRKNNISVLYHQFNHPVYPQLHSKEFVPQLSSIDLLFNCGIASRDYLNQKI
ncbi:WbqC family protein [Ammoniphilus sp. 3BR4]|uniref:WbqC family protein n=1 Tax=Ammoniphilus sp. 3BR4 TaxID=3158265 RepID=UPI003467365A